MFDIVPFPPIMFKRAPFIRIASGQMLMVYTFK